MQEGEDIKHGTEQARTDFWRDPRPTNENPNFVRDYFASSRLHFIGSFRARYESMMVAVGRKLGIKPGQLLQSSAEKGILSSKSKPSERVIVHIDMDCFFASIAVKKDPSLAGKCIAVCHGGGEISSCSYEARKFGVHAGMFFRDGRKLCPDLLSVPYAFPMYEEASIEIYAIFYDCPGVCVEAISVDEAYLDITLAIGDDRDGSQTGAEALVQSLRTNIAARTGCTASAGIGPSKLIARLATKAAKPNGQIRVRQENVIAYLDTLKVKDLPGIGWRTTRRLEERGVVTLPQLRALSLSALQSEFGERQGQVFYNFARALDVRPVEPLKPRKSIGAEASWGVRFTKEENDKARKFITDMADEVAGRVEAAGALGTKIVFKEYRRIPNSSMVGYKHLGHGPCTICTRSAKIPPTSAVRSLKEALRQTCLRIHDDLGVRSEELRGVGVQMTDLSFADLKFDHTLAATAGSTRRIESFFETAVTPTKVNASVVSQKPPPGRTQLDEPQLKDHQGDRPTSQAWEGGTRETDKRWRADRSNELIGNDKGVENGVTYFSEEGRGETGRDPDESDEDRIRVGRAPELRCASKRSREIEDVQVVEADDVDIPDGWDKHVFAALPKELQGELLKESGRMLAQQLSTGTIVVEDGADPNSRVLGRAKRRREKRVKQVVFQSEKRKRRKMSAQVTMTQIADISELKERGHDVLDAEEFREKPLRDCMELLGDLRGKPLNVRTIRTGKTKHEESGGGDEGKRGAEIEARDEDGLDIPSPPSFSSDSESDGSVTDALLRQGLGHSQIYEDEDVCDYAEVLKRWMELTGNDVKSGHVELVRGRMLELVRMKRLERLCTEMRVMGKYAGEEGMCGWGEHFNEIVDEVQDECKRMYKMRVAIPKVEMGE